MAEKLIINATGAALAAQGETTAAWTVAESTGAPTVTEQGAVTDLDGFAIMQTSASTDEKAAVAWCILDSLISGIDLSTVAKREAFRLKAGLDEWKVVLATLPKNITGQLGG